MSARELLARFTSRFIWWLVLLTALWALVRGIA